MNLVKIDTRYFNLDEIRMIVTTDNGGAIYFAGVSTDDATAVTANQLMALEDEIERARQSQNN